METIPEYNWYCGRWAGGAGSYAMATSLAGAMYNWVMAHTDQRGHFCHGPLCFRYTFLIVAALCTVGTVFAALVWVRSRTAYRAVIKVHLPPPPFFPSPLARATRLGASIREAPAGGQTHKKHTKKWTGGGGL